MIFIKLNKKVYVTFLIVFFTNIPIQLFSQQVTEATALAKFNEGKYELALKEYMSLYKTDAENPKLNYQIGRCFIRLNADRTRAISYFEKIVEKEEYVNNQQFYYDFAIAHFHAHHFDVAIYMLNKSLSLTKEESVQAKIEQQIETCLNAQALIKSPLNVKFVNLGNKVNSRFAEAHPYVSDDETQLLFSSNRELSYDIYVSKKRKNSESWGKSKSLSAVINTINDEMVAGLSHDGDILFVHYNDFSTLEDINVSKQEGGKYKELESAGENVNGATKEEGAALSITEDTLYFASNRPGGLGGMDIYYSLKLPNHKWGLPINMGPTINTKYDDNYPNLSGDSKTLYFASKGHNSMGGYDIYYSKLDSLTNQWTEPQNFGYPINDTYDNTNITMLASKRYAYISSIRKDGLGDYDVYKLIFNESEPENIIYKGVIAVGDTAGHAAKMLKEIDPNISITIYKRDSDEVFGIYSYNKNNGSYIISLVPGNYELVISGDSYLEYRKNLDIGEEYFKDKLRNQNIYLQLKDKTLKN